MRVFLLYIFMLIALTGCQSEFHAYDTRIDGARNIHARTIPLIEERTASKSVIRFVFLSDTQRWYDEFEDAVECINSLADIDFVIHGGDMTDWGLNEEFERQRDILEKLNVPYVALIGNHDCIATGRVVYEKIFGPAHFAFTAGRFRFVCSNTNALEYNDFDPVPDMDFLDRELASYPAEAAHTVAVMHAAPLTEQLFGHKAFAFHEALMRFPSLQFCLNGHGHKFETHDTFEDGMLYIQSDCIFERNLLIFTLTEDGYSYEQHYF